MNTESHEERADKIISMMVWLDSLPLHRRATLRDMIVAGMMEAVAYERERNQNNVAAADIEIKKLTKLVRQLPSSEDVDACENCLDGKHIECMSPACTCEFCSQV